MGGCCSKQDVQKSVLYHPIKQELEKDLHSNSNELRVLCLHGFRTNASIMEIQSIAFKTAFEKDSIQMTYLNAFHKATGPPYDEVVEYFGPEGPYFEWWKVHGTSYLGWKQSLEYILQHMKSVAPYDVILGFSQGATMATLLSAHFSAIGKLPIKAVVLVCGLAPIEGIPSSVNMIDVPSFHILGTQDPVYDAGKELTQLYNPTTCHVFHHPEGHKFPSFPHSEDIFQQISVSLRDVCSKKAER